MLENSGFALWSIVVLKFMIFALGMVAAIASWRRYHWAAWRFVPMVLLCGLGEFIFPIYAYGEYACKKASGGYDLKMARFKRLFSWAPVVAAQFLAWGTEAIFHYSMGDGYLVLRMACYLCAALFVALLFLWVSRTLDRWERAAR